MEKLEIEQTKRLTSETYPSSDDDDQEEYDEGQITKECENGEDVIFGIMKAINDGKYLALMWAFLCVLIGIYMSTSGYSSYGVTTSAAISMDDFVSRLLI